MKKAKMILLFIALIITCSCKTAIMKMAGLRKPGIETKTSIVHYLQKLKQDTNDVYTLDTTLMENLRRESFKPGMAKGFRPVQIRIYDKNGEPVMQWASCEGFLKDLKTFDSVPPRNHNGLNKSLKLQEDLSRYYTLDGTSSSITVPTGFDYFILIYFAKYFPRLSKESFRQVEKYALKHNELKMKIYKINVDVQKFWGVELENEMDIHAGSDKK